MSEHNVEVAKRAIGAFNERDIDTFASLTTPGFEWSPSMVAIEGETFLGRDGIEKYFGQLEGAWERFQILTGDFRETEEVVVMLGRLDARGKTSGVPVDAPLGMVFDVRDGAISRIRGFLDHADALRTAGLPE
jgi:ketosteroid isomerase-like protein